MFLPVSIDIDHSEKYILSIRITDKGLMFSISDLNDGKNYCLRETAFSPELSVLENVKRIFFELSFFALEYKQVNVVCVSADYDIVPKEFYDFKYSEELYRMVHAQDCDHIQACKQEKQEALTVFGMEAALYEFLCRNLCNPYFTHHASLLIDYLSEKGKNISLSSKMFVYFHDGLCDILCYRQSQLKHCITITEESAINQTYFILKACEQSNFDQYKDDFYIVGDADEELVTELSKYIKNIETIGVPSEVFLWNEDALNAPIDLLSLSL